MNNKTEALKATMNYYSLSVFWATGLYVGRS